MTSPPNHMGDDSSLRSDDAAAHPAPAASAWYPIETAPEGYERFLAWGPELDCPVSVTRGARARFVLAHGGWYPFLDNLTHWMPPFIPPEIGAKGNPGATNNPADRITALEEALRELADAAEIDMKNNQAEGDDDGPGGWWSLRTEWAIAKARALTAEGEGK